MSGGEAALRIAFDMDGVLADMHTALAVEAARMFKEHEQFTVDALEEALEHEPPPPGGPAPAASAHPTLTGQQMELLWQRVAGTHNFWEGLPETESGIVARLARVAHERRWEVIFITQRPPTEGSIVQKQTQTWLRRHGFDYPSVYTTRGSRGAIAAALHLDVVVDDRYEGCVDVVNESAARSVLVWRERDEGVPARATRIGITVVRSAGECLEVLEHAQRPGISGRGLMNRLRRTFGLRRR